MDERRQLPRFRIRQFIELSYDREEFLQAEGVDLSSGGLKLKTFENLENGTRIYVMLSFLVKDKEEMFKSEGIVVHSSRVEGGYELGVQFDLPPEEEKAKLLAYLAQLD